MYLSIDRYTYAHTHARARLPQAHVLPRDEVGRALERLDAVARERQVHCAAARLRMGYSEYSHGYSVL